MHFKFILVHLCLLFRIASALFFLIVRIDFALIVVEVFEVRAKIEVMVLFDVGAREALPRLLLNRIEYVFLFFWASHDLILLRHKRHQLILAIRIEHGDVECS